jgi:hypothetical protein
VDISSAIWARKYPQRYFEYAETIWNLQPVKGEVNNLKTNTPPQKFFEEHPEYLNDYDFLPNQNPKTEIWLDKNIKDFVISRRKKMVRFSERKYGIKVDIK